MKIPDFRAGFVEALTFTLMMLRLKLGRNCWITIPAKGVGGLRIELWLGRIFQRRSGVDALCFAASRAQVAIESLGIKTIRNS